jgi:hypothetical protein
MRDPIASSDDAPRLQILSSEMTMPESKTPRGKALSRATLDKRAHLVESRKQMLSCSQRLQQ